MSIDRQSYQINNPQLPALTGANSQDQEAPKVAKQTSGIWKRVNSSSDLQQRKSTDSLPGSRPPSGDLASLEKRLVLGINRTVQLQDSEGEALKVSHNYKGNTLADETAKRIPGKKALTVVLERSYNNMSEKATALRTEINTLKSDSSNPPLLQKKSAQLEKLEAKLTRTGVFRSNLMQDETVGKRKFFDSNYHREYMSSALKGHDRATLTGQEYQKIANKTNPGLVHARNVELTVKDEHGVPTETYGLLRVGVMSDLTNGATNLEELGKIANGDTALQEKALASLEKRQSAYSKGSPTYASFEMAIDQIKNPKVALEARSERMELMMLQYLSAQAERDISKLEKLGDKDTWGVVDVRLLNPKKDEIDKESGWVHNETNELLDMKKIFEQFSGKTIVLDGKGPFIDDEGKVHLGIDAGGKEINLSATLLNISVQGQMENTGLQADINSEAIEALKSNPALADDDDWKGMIELLAAGKSNGTVAEKAVTALVKAGFSVSVGCLSAKDRTGWVVGRAVTKLLANNTPEIRKFLTKKLLGSQSMAAQILKDVTGWRFMKLDYKTMGDDVTTPQKIRHTVGLVAEWAVNAMQKKLGNFKETEPVTLINQRVSDLTSSIRNSLIMKS